MNDAASVTQHSLEAERAVLGAVLISETNWSPVSSLLRETDFYRDAHRKVFTAMAHLFERGVGLDALLVVEELRRTAELDAVGGAAYVFSLTDGIPTHTNVAHYAGVIASKARWRAIGTVAKELEASAATEAGAPEQIVTAGSNALMALVESPVLGLHTVQQVATKYLDGLISGQSRESFTTGRAAVDALASLARRGELTYLACRPTTGATAFALAMAKKLSGEAKPVLYVSSRVSQRLLAARLIAWASGVPSESVETGTAEAEQYGRIVAAVDQVDPTEPLYFETGSRTVAEVSAWMRRVKSDHGLACVFVDPLHGILSGSSAKTRESDCVAAAKALKREAERLDVAVVVLVQVDRAPESRSDKRPHLSELRVFGAEEADVVALLFREELHRKRKANEGTAEFIMVKNRGGATGVVKMSFDKSIGRFEDAYEVPA